MTTPGVATTDEVDARAWLTLVIAATAGFMVALEITIISVAFPRIREAFPSSSPATLSWIFTAYNIGVAALLLLAGSLADRVGRRPVFLTGLLVFAAGSAGSGLAPTAELVIASRVLQSAGGALLFPSGLALVLDAFPPRRRQTAVGVWGATSGLAAAIGPSLGSVLVQAFGWRAVFLINVPVALVAVVVGLRYLPRPPKAAEAARTDKVAVPFASLAVGCLILAITRAESAGWASPVIIGTLLAGVACMAFFLWRSLRHPVPLFDLGLFRLRSYAAANFAAFVFAVAFFDWLVLLPTYLQRVWGWSVLEAGFAIAPSPLLSALLAPISGRIADRFGARPLLVLCGVSGAAGMTAHLLFTGLTPSFVAGVLVPGLLLGVCSANGFSLIVGAAMRDVPPHRFGMAGAGRTTVFQLATAVGIAVGAAIAGRERPPAEWLDAFRASWVVALVLMLVLAVSMFVAYPAGPMRHGAPGR